MAGNESVFAWTPSVRPAHFLFGLRFVPELLGRRGGKHGRLLQITCLSLLVALKASAPCDPPESRENLQRCAQLASDLYRFLLLGD